MGGFVVFGVDVVRNAVGEDGIRDQLGAGADPVEAKPFEPGNQRAPLRANGAAVIEQFVVAARR